MKVCIKYVYFKAVDKYAHTSPASSKRSKPFLMLRLVVADAGKLLILGHFLKNYTIL